ncbi:hypothetical protein SAMN05421504_10224 [Amycolatopsis xylanica]|uniref:PPE family protein n=1 Tax=Amycolatopsis xylanica TaxID=589385 RepID=A0A1H2Y5B3_9PSEU|nr:hypothetical protein [Amycolatopsis xylanica]SDX00392.1 hypothetical protein SAMN05421504_10224 [Amycolatopsis xylanica]
MSFWDIFGGNVCMDGQAIYENFTSKAQGPRGLVQGSVELGKVEALYTLREQQITDLAASMEEGWTGDSSGAAQRGAGPLAVEHGRAAQEMATARNLLMDQTESFSNAQTTVVPVPKTPEEPSTFKKVITLGGAQSDYEKGVRESQEASQKNVTAMDGWTSASNYNGSMMPTEYGDLPKNTFTIERNEPKIPPIIEPHWPGPGPYPGGDGDGDKNKRGKPGTIDPGKGSVDPGKDDGRKPGDIKPPPTDTGRPPTRDERTTPEDDKSKVKPPPQWPDDRIPGKTGKTPGDDTIGGGGWNTGGNRNLDTGTGSGRSIGTGGGSNSGSGSAGGRLTGGGSSGAGATGASDRLGGGRGSGAGAMGPGEPGARGGAGARGAGGRGAGQGMGGMGHGGRGGGEEDEEHQRKYVLEDDAAFQLTDEDGEKYVDPRTGMSPVTPVIGE